MLCGATWAIGTCTERSTYRPFDEQDEVVTGTPVNETKGFIGERYDADAGLQYLNARYYDPKLGLFLQPDWFEVTEAGVGTIRCAHAGNDPVNGSDPGGNYWGEKIVNAVLGGLGIGSRAALAGIAADMATPDPTDAYLLKWGAEAVVGILAGGIVWATGGSDSSRFGIGGNEPPEGIEPDQGGGRGEDPEPSGNSGIAIGAASAAASNGSVGGRPDGYTAEEAIAELSRDALPGRNTRGPTALHTRSGGFEQAVSDLTRVASNQVERIALRDG